jgi:hypothetical protein
MALNLLYPQPTGSRDLDYWFVELPYHVGVKNIPDFVAGKPIDFSFRKYSFSGSSLDGLAIFYEPEAGRCLWVFSPQDRYNPEIPALTEEVIPISNLSRIVTGDAPDGYPPSEIFGDEPSHTWCYFYQKADLARQMGDWERVVELADRALDSGYKPINPHERLPFIEAYAHVGNWPEALRQTRKAYEKNARYATQLCYLWGRIDQDLEVPPEFGEELVGLYQQMQCH